jgi:uncharacterized protein (TIGR00369 family)
MLPTLSLGSGGVLEASEHNDAQQLHQHCCVCAQEAFSPYGLGVKFFPLTQDSVYAELRIESRHQGYEGLLHGGIASALLDGAMTHCLLQQNIPALTAELTVRFHQPIELGDSVYIMAKIAQKRHGIYSMEGQLTVEGKCCVSAKAKFLRPKQK